MRCSGIADARRCWPAAVCAATAQGRSHRAAAALCDAAQPKVVDGPVRLEQIVLETSGLADPGPIVAAIRSDPVLGLSYHGERDRRRGRRAPRAGPAARASRSAAARSRPPTGCRDQGRRARCGSGCSPRSRASTRTRRLRRRPRRGGAPDFPPRQPDVLPPLTRRRRPHPPHARFDLARSRLGGLHGLALGAPACARRRRGARQGRGAHARRPAVAADACARSCSRPRSCPSRAMRAARTRPSSSSAAATGRGSAAVAGVLLR